VVIFILIERAWSGGRVVRQRSAKPCTAVQIRSGPQFKLRKAEVAELAYARHLKCREIYLLWVQIPPSARFALFMFHEKRKNFIITADDFGKNELANRNILKLAKSGKLDRVSVMADGVFAPGEIEDLVATGVKIDVHFELVWQKRRRNLLSDKALRQVAVFFANFVWGDWPVPENPRSGRKSVKKEWARQIEKFREIFGRVPDGISSHEHTHYFPVYFSIALDLANHFDIPFIRFGKKGFSGKGSSKKMILGVLRQIDSRKFFKSKMDSADYFTSLDWIDGLEKFSGDIPEGKTEMACHPERKEEFELIEKYF
jgi:predicted glycoside hydrolase/deacetylase ChbG (UPF0249 family)